MAKKLVDYIQEIQKKIEKLEIYQKGYLEDESLVAFRGEPRDFGKTKLMPSLFRNPEMVEKEPYIFELISDYGILEPDKNRLIDKAIESQHYVAISRMLDITFSILPALYFACVSEADMQEDGIVHVFCFPEHYSPHSAYLEEFYKNVMNERSNIAYSKNFKVITHSYSNERIQAQTGGFIFFPGKEYIPISHVYCEEVIISSCDKSSVLLDLKKMFGIEDATLFPEKSTRAELVKRKLENDQYTKREVSVENEISTFFERIQFEVEIQKRKGNLDKRNVLRWLRKEKDDLLSYIQMVVKTEKEVEQYRKQIEKAFRILEKMC